MTCQPCKQPPQSRTNFVRALLLCGILFFAPASVFAQNTSSTPTPAAPAPLRMAGYFGILHPLITFDQGETVTNFTDYYLVGFPTGINLWKTSNIGFSVEMVPFVRADKAGSRMSNFLFHPGVLVSLGHGYTFAGRLAFETSGRYGVTPVLNKVVRKNKNSTYFVAVPIPVRFGNTRPTTLTVGFQFGIAF